MMELEELEELDYDEERDWVVNNPLEAHDEILRLRRELEKAVEWQHRASRRLSAVEQRLATMTRIASS